MPKGDNPNSKKALLKTGEANKFKKGYKRTKTSIKKQKQTLAAKRTFKELMNIALEKQITSKTGEVMTTKEAIIAKAVVDAVKGNRAAREFCRDTAGEKPVERVMIAEVSQDVIDEVEKMVNDDS